MEETEHGPEMIFAVEFNIAAGNSARWNSDRSDAGLNESCFRGQEYGCFDWWNVFPSTNLRNEFEAGDPRYGYCFYENGDPYGPGGTLTASISDLGQAGGAPDYPRAGWKKYQNYYKQATEGDVSAQASGINMSVIRYADVLLMMAECEANRSGGDLNTAIDYMNEVRDRADVSMPHYPTVDYPITNLAEFMVALEHERKVELCGEQVRWNDLIRWGRAVEFINSLITNHELPVQEEEQIQFNANKLLWPIPQAEIDVNISLSQADQNPGY